MPEITLTDHPHDIGWIRSVMLFPNDETLRNQNYAVEVAKYEVGNIESVTENGFILELRSWTFLLALNALSY